MPRFGTTVACFMFPTGICKAMLSKPGMEASTVPGCNTSVMDDFAGKSTVLRTDPGGIRSVMADIRFDNGDGVVCLAETNNRNKFTRLSVRQRANFDSAACCSAEENTTMQIIKSTARANWSDLVFGDLPQRQLRNVSFYQVEPRVCKQSGRCPLVIELGGGQSIPEAFAIYYCKTCKKMLGVVMVGLQLGVDYDTDVAFVNGTFLPWAADYIEHSTTIDRQRVYLTSTSRGNEVAFKAAIINPGLFKWVVLTGKFKIGSELLVANQGDSAVFEKAASKGLKGMIFHLGDNDVVIEDRVFYPELTHMLGLAAHATTAPIMHVINYPRLPHDLTLLAWSEMFDLLWTAESSEVDW